MTGVQTCALPILFCLRKGRLEKVRKKKVGVGKSLRKEVLGRHWEGPFDKKPFDKNPRPPLKLHENVRKGNDNLRKYMKM